MNTERERTAPAGPREKADSLSSNPQDIRWCQHRGAWKSHDGMCKDCEIERLRAERDALGQMTRENVLAAVTDRNALIAALEDARATFRRISGEILEDKYQYRRWAEECLRRIGVADLPPRQPVETTVCVAPASAGFTASTSTDADSGQGQARPFENSTDNERKNR